METCKHCSEDASETCQKCDAFICGNHRGLRSGAFVCINTPSEGCEVYEPPVQAAPESSTEEASAEGDSESDTGGDADATEGESAGEGEGGEGTDAGTGDATEGTSSEEPAPKKKGKGGSA